MEIEKKTPPKGEKKPLKDPPKKEKQAPAPEVEPKKPSSPSKVVTIDIDTPMEKVVELDNNGVELEFDHHPEKFLRLPSDVTRELSYNNKQRYFVSKGMAEETLDLSAYDQRMFKPEPGRAMATDRLEVLNKDPNFHYCWKRPDELQHCKMDGYVIADDRQLGTFHGDVGSARTVGADGKTELVLMKLPKEKYQQQRAANKELNQRRKAGVEQDAKAFIERKGGAPARTQIMEQFTKED